MSRLSAFFLSTANGLVLLLDQNIMKLVIVTNSSVYPKVLSDMLFVFRAHNTITYFVTRNRKATEFYCGPQKKHVSVGR
jgi:hypothetical protein